MLSGNRSIRISSGTAPQQRSRFSSPVGLGSRETFLAMPRWPQLTLTTTRLARSRQAGSTLESSPDLPPTHSADQNAGSRNGLLPARKPLEICQSRVLRNSRLSQHEKSLSKTSLFEKICA